jgi:hypothetical protein
VIHVTAFCVPALKLQDFIGDRNRAWRRYMLRRDSPLTSNNAFVICPSEYTRTVFIRSAKTLPLSITAKNVAAARAIAACPIYCSSPTATPAGNALNAYDTVRAFERAGVAGLMLGDQVWPKRCGHLKGKEVISAEEMVQKIRAAAEARADHPAT